MRKRIIMLIVMGAMGIGLWGGTVYRFDFNSDPAKAGWTYTPQRSGAEAAPVWIESEGYALDKGGKLTSPAIKVVENPFQFYRLKFHGKADTKGYYAVFFQDGQGQHIVADIYASVYPGENWRDNTVCFRGREGAVTFTVNFINTGKVQVRNVEVATVAPAEVAQWADELYATLPPLDFTPDPERWKLLPKTMRRLQEGGPLRVVMLGDSIINDTNNSNYDALLMRLYPRAEIRVICSVRGSTGCWHYHPDEQFQSYVADLKPDLLMIGGISNQRGDNPIEDMRTVIRKAKERLGCEILVMSGPVAADWRQRDSKRPDVSLPASTPPALPAFYQEMAQMAQEEGVEFFDMYTPWHRYLAASCRPWMYFHRDRVHADDRGKQILARLLERYFAPKQ